MKIIIAKNYESMSQKAAEQILDEIRKKPDMLLCIATGSTPNRTYELLAEYFITEPGLFDKLRIIKLDEWGGLAMDDPASCESYIRKRVMGPLGISEERYFTFNSDPENPAKECKKFQKLLDREGPIDICILGLGLDGHLGLNEPGAALKPHMHVNKLKAVSMKHSMLNEAKGTPKYGLTLGILDIMSSKKILLLINGESKREPTKKLMSKKINTKLPGSMLWMHQNTTCICDEAVMPELPKGKLDIEIIP
jgi:galactosamine-6-phosphate isomerase